MEKIVISSNENVKSEILIEKGLINSIEDFINDNFFLITNDTLAKLYSDIVKKFDKKRVIIIKDGEKYKNIKTYTQIINKLLKEKIERKDTIAALGGGVVGDLAGFCASSVLRGVKLIQIPTTLLAMCDSSIGGKTGFNSQYGKNLIGSFYLANKVLIDPVFLNTLNEYEYKCGLGEIVKYALIEKSCKCEINYNLLDVLSKYQSLDVKKEIEYIIKACVHLKARVVELDRLEGSLRKILNFGHTYAHAVETLSNYKKISHGEAVAYGINCAAKLSYNLGIIDRDYFNRIDYLLNKFQLLQKEIKYKKTDIIEIMKQDKKVENQKINLLVPTAPAVVGLFDNIDLPSIEASLP